MKTNIETFLRWEQLMIMTFGGNGRIAVNYVIESLRQQKEEGLTKLPTLFFIGGCDTGKTALAESIMKFLNSKSLCLMTTTYAAIKQEMDANPKKAMFFEEYTDNNCDDRVYTLIRQNASPDRQYNRPMIVTAQYAPLKDDGYLKRHCVIVDLDSQPFADHRCFTDSQRESFKRLKELEKHTDVIREEIISYLNPIRDKN